MHSERDTSFRLWLRGAGLFLVVASALLLSGCKLKPRVIAPGTNADGVDADCANWYSTMDGPYRYENNVWGKGKAKKGFEQCLLDREVGGRTERGWTWNWPGFDSTVFAYPEIVFGWKPWSGGEPTDPRMPMKVADITQLSLTFEVETTATGTYNLAPEIWLTRSGAWSKNPNPALISTEVMFWMDYGGEAEPAGKIADRPTIAGIEYELWRADNFGAGGKWTYIALKSTKIRHQGVIDMLAVLRYLAQQGAIDPNHYVASIEFGNEIMGGSGTTWVKRFEIQAQSKAQ
jgi:hypothetical protein